MRTIAQCHERKKRPLIIDCRISPLLRAKPALDFRSSAKRLAVFLAREIVDSSLSMMKAHHRHQRHKAMPIAIAATRHTLSIRRRSSRHHGFLVRTLHLEILSNGSSTNSNPNASSNLFSDRMSTRVKDQRSPHHGSSPKIRRFRFVAQSFSLSGMHWLPVKILTTEARLAIHPSNHTSRGKDTVTSNKKATPAKTPHAPNVPGLDTEGRP